MRSGIWRWHYPGPLAAMRSSFKNGVRSKSRLATTQTRRRRAEENQESFIPVSPARWYTLVNNPGFGRHTLEPLGPAGLAAFFTFTSCVDFSIAGARTGVPDRS
jgi:hypothetical protein